ncbi:hypothetical protein LCGC14_1552110 [marine sediment metagenome]|uniref:Uncharacterized protein n=1 Tax=marine sediment metagenome TaxID=412755 RepID=A0A0F9L630_9ZZZZ
MWIVGGLYCLIVDIDPVELNLVVIIIHVLWYALTASLIVVGGVWFWDNADRVAVRINRWVQNL